MKPGASSTASSRLAQAPALEDDRRLMRRVAEGELAAQRELAERLAGRAHRTARALLRDPADTADAVQESLVEVLRSAHTYRGDAPLERWADRIIVRRSLRLRKTQRRDARRIEDGVELEAFAAPAGPTSLTERMVRPVEHYMSQLSDAMRTALLLRYGAGHSIAEIAAETGASTKRAEKRVLAALARLRKMIATDVEARSRRAP